MSATTLAGSARADWFFGLFGGSEAAPAPRADAASYKVEIQIVDKPEDKGLASILQDASNLYRLMQQPPENGEGIARRASADLPRLVDALWAEGYYDASARAFVDGQPIDMGGTGLEAAANAAERAIGRSVIAVRLAVEAGALYRSAKSASSTRRRANPSSPTLSSRES